MPQGIQYSSPPWRLISQVIFLGFLTIAISLFIDPAAALLCLALLIILYLFFKFPAHGLYLLIFFYPLLGLRLTILQVPESLYKYFPDGFDAAYVDIIALGLLLGFLARLFYLWLAGKAAISHRRFPLWPFFLAFLAVSALSVINSVTPLLSWKYMARPLFFFFACFVFLPWNVIDSRKVFYTAVRVFWLSGILAALAAFGYFVFDGGSFSRLLPAQIFDIYPWGENWNLLAEIMVAVWPAGIILYYVSKSKYRATYFAGAILMIFVALGTFSRTAWIALFAQGCLWLFLEYHGRARKLLPYVLIAAALLLPMIGYMYFLTVGPIVESSTTARLALTGIAVYLFTLHPFFGNGAGTFVDNLGGIQYFNVEFGEPLDAHGFVQKLIAEEGMLGLLAFGALLAAILWKLLRQYLVPERALQEKIIFFFFLTAVGSVIYQFFNTQYYSSKLWVPLGLAMVASRLGRK